MSHKNIPDLEFALVCLKSVGTKPDFNVVATQLGCTANQAYHRHWRLMKNTNLNSVVAAAGGTSAPKTPSKRGRKPKAIAAPGNGYGDDDLEDDDEENVANKKKIKTPEKAKGKGKAKAEAEVKEENLVVKVEDDEDDDAATVGGESVVELSSEE